MSGTSPKQLEADKAGDARKSGDACWRNAQRSTGPQTPSDGRAATGGRGSRTVAVNPFGGWDDIPVGRTAVAYRRLNAIECQLHRAIRDLQRLQEHRCLSNPQPSETPPMDEN